MNLFRSRLRGVVLALGIVLVAASCGDAASSDPVVEVRGVSLTLDEVVALVNGPESATVDKSAAATAITGWVRTELFYAELAARGYEPADEVLAPSRRALEDLALNNPEVPDLDSFVGQEAIRAQALTDVIENYLLEFVGVEPDWPVQLCSAHILLETEEDADAVVARLDDGEDFGAVAIEVSIGPSGPSGGELGCVDPGSFDADFVAGAAAVDAPGVTPPVESQFGWHVINVYSFEGRPPEDPAVRFNILFSTEEYAELQDAAVAHEVTLDETYGTWETDGYTVVPPVG